MRKVVATAVLGCLAAFSSDAMAGYEWRVQTSNNVAECAKAAASSRTLSCVGNGTGNYRVRYKVPLTANKWDYDGTAAGISITKDANHKHWLIASVDGFSDSVWFRDSGGWHEFPRNRCEDGAPIRTRHAVGDHTIAVGWDGTNNHHYIVERGGNVHNTLRRWNGNCWLRMPLLPSAAGVREVAIFEDWNTTHDAMPWVVTMDGFFYRWSGTAWVFIPNGMGTGVGGVIRTVIGLGDTTLWNYNQNTGVFTQDTTWRFGAITQIGTSFSSGIGDAENVVAADGRLFWKLLF